MDGDPNLVIPLHDKSKDGSGKPQPAIIRNRMPGYNTMVHTPIFLNIRTRMHILKWN